MTLQEGLLLSRALTDPLMQKLEQRKAQELAVQQREADFLRQLGMEEEREKRKREREQELFQEEMQDIQAYEQAGERGEEYIPKTRGGYAKQQAMQQQRAEQEKARQRAGFLRTLAEGGKPSPEEWETIAEQEMGQDILGILGKRQEREAKQKREEEARAFRERQFGATQAHRAKKLGLQRQRLAKEKPEAYPWSLVKAKDKLTGEQIYVERNKKTGEMRPVSLPGQEEETIPQNPVDQFLPKPTYSQMQL